MNSVFLFFARRFDSFSILKLIFLTFSINPIILYCTDEKKKKLKCTFWHLERIFERVCASSPHSQMRSRISLPWHLSRKYHFRFSCRIVATLAAVAAVIRSARRRIVNLQIVSRNCKPFPSTFPPVLLSRTNFDFGTMFTSAVPVFIKSNGCVTINTRFSPFSRWPTKFSSPALYRIKSSVSVCCKKLLYTIKLIINK